MYIFLRAYFNIYINLTRKKKREKKNKNISNGKIINTFCLSKFNKNLISQHFLIYKA